MGNETAGTRLCNGKGRFSFSEQLPYDRLQNLIILPIKISSQALRDPQDSRQVVFTVLPTHGVVVTEKWMPGKQPFQVIWECMDAGYLQVDRRIPQGPMKYVPSPDGRMVLSTPLEQQDRVRSTG